MADFQWNCVSSCTWSGLVNNFVSLPGNAQLEVYYYYYYYLLRSLSSSSCVCLNSFELIEHLESHAKGVVVVASGEDSRASIAIIIIIIMAGVHVGLQMGKQNTLGGLGRTV